MHRCSHTYRLSAAQLKLLLRVALNNSAGQQSVSAVACKQRPGHALETQGLGMVGLSIGGFGFSPSKDGLALAREVASRYRLSLDSTLVRKGGRHDGEPVTRFPQPVTVFGYEGGE